MLHQTVLTVRLRGLLFGMVFSAIAFTGYDKQEFACIPIAAVYNNTGCERVKVTLKYEQFLCTVPLFSPRKQQKQTPDSFEVNSYIIVMTHVILTFT